MVQLPLLWGNKALCFIPVGLGPAVLVLLRQLLVEEGAEEVVPALLTLRDTLLFQAPAVDSFGGGSSLSDRLVRT